MFGRFVSFARSTKAFGRLTAAGLGLSCVVTGYASAQTGFNLHTVGLLLVVGLAFHVVAFALNDLFDLEIDRTDPSRAGSPLVAGTITPRTAGIVIGVIGLASFGVDLVGFGMSFAAAAWLVGAYAGLFLYDAYSKRISWPVVMDAVQGLGWACLVGYAAERGGGPTAATWLTGAFTFLFVVLVNGVHGGLRDLDNDSRRGARTTAIAFGARPTPTGVVVPRRLQVYSWSLQAAMGAVAVVAIVAISGGHRTGRLGWYAAGLALTIAAMVLHRAGFAAADNLATFKNIGAAHILLCYLPLTTMAAVFGGWRQGFTAGAVMFLPMLGNDSFRTSFRSLPELVARGLRRGRARPGPALGGVSSRRGVTAGASPAAGERSVGTKP